MRKSSIIIISIYSFISVLTYTCIYVGGKEEIEVMIQEFINKYGQEYESYIRKQFVQNLVKQSICWPKILVEVGKRRRNKNA